jgi:hypothetical protein
MRKLIDIPDEQVATLKKLAVDNDVSFKKYLEDVLIKNADFANIVNSSNNKNLEDNIQKYFVENFEKISVNRIDVAHIIELFFHNECNRYYRRENETKENLKDRADKFKEIEDLLKSHDNYHLFFELNCYNDECFMMNATDNHAFDYYLEFYTDREVINKQPIYKMLTYKNSDIYDFKFTSTCRETSEKITIKL